MHLLRGLLLTSLVLLGSAGWVRAQSPSPAAVRTEAARAKILAAEDSHAALTAAKRALVFARREGGQAARARVAEAMLDAQLFTEALMVLDDVLNEDPDERVARGVLARPELELGVPKWSSEPIRAELLRFQLQDLGKRSGGARRERVLTELARAQGRQRRVLLVELESSMSDARPEVRRFASLALRRLAPGHSLARLQRHAVLDPDEAVRHEAARGLRDATEPEGVVAIAALLDEPIPLLRVRAAETLALAGYTSAVTPLIQSLLAPPVLASGGSSGGRPAGTIFVGTQHSFLQGYEAEVAQGAAIANPIIGVVQTGATLTARVQGVSTIGGVSLATSQRSLRLALEELTGQSFPSSQGWRKWWETEGRQRALTPPAATVVTPGG